MRSALRCSEARPARYVVHSKVPRDDEVGVAPVVNRVFWSPVVVELNDVAHEDDEDNKDLGVVAEGAGVADDCRIVDDVAEVGLGEF